MTSAPRLLGYIGQAPSDPLEALHREHRPALSLPAYVRCEARRNPGALGVRRCKALVCPRCHRDRIKARRNVVYQFVADACEAGAGLRFLTLTSPHESGAPLRLCTQVLQTSWTAARSGSPYTRLKRMGLLGVVNFLDVTYGQHGWHVHFHCLVVTRTKAIARKISTKLLSRYRRHLHCKGLGVTSKTADDQHVYAPKRLAGYFARTWWVSPKDGSVTPLGLLQRALDGCSRAGELFFELAEAMARRRCLTISPQLRQAVSAL